MKFEFDHRTGTMQPKKNEEIYFAQSQGGGLIVDDKKHNIKYIIERNETITKLFGSFDKDKLNLYDMRDARIISDRVVRLLGRDHKYSDFHYFLKGYVMKENVIKSCTDFIGESVWGDLRKRSSGDVTRRENNVSYDTLTDQDCTVDTLYDYLIVNYKPIGDKEIVYTDNKEIEIPITLSDEPILITRNIDALIFSIECPLSLKEYIDKTEYGQYSFEENGILEIIPQEDDDFTMYCSSAVKLLDELLDMVPNPALKIEYLY